MRGGLPLESLFEIEVPFPEKENNSELKSAALLQSKLQRLCAADFDSIHVIRCSDYKSLRRACLAVDLLDLKLFPQTKACTTRVRFVLTFYRITSVHQDLLSWLDSTVAEPCQRKF